MMNRRLTNIRRALTATEEIMRRNQFTDRVLMDYARSARNHLRRARNATLAGEATAGDLYLTNAATHLGLVLERANALGI